MRFRNPILICLLVAGTGAASTDPNAYDPCATFFWTNQYNEPVERYKPKYLIGQGLEDVGMGHIIGIRIRHKWSQQAAACFASTNRYGYFSHPNFERRPDRFKKLSEKLTDVRNVVLQLSQSSADAVYQESLRRAKTESYVVIGTMANAAASMADFYDRLVADYDFFIDRLGIVIDIALPPSVRTAVLDEFCSPDNVAELEVLEDECIEADNFCELTFLYQTINNCSEYQDGATLEDLLGAISENFQTLQGERDELASESQSITDLWAEIEQLED